MKTDQFEVTDEKIANIAKQFDIDVPECKKLYNDYLDLYRNMNIHYLAHMIRTLEAYVRKIQKSPRFIISCFPDTRLNDFKLEGGFYMEKDYFTVIYPPDMDPMQLRECIAHELGHLFLRVRKNNSEVSDEMEEKLSSIFGVFTIFDKNDFYTNKTISFKHHTWQEIVADFKLLSNKAKGIFNKS